VSILTPAQAAFAEAQRAGRMATADRAGQPHVVPVCYAYADGSFYIALDAKPKRVAHERLKRVRNILDNPQVALVIDRYDEDWSALAYLLARGSAALLPPGDLEHTRAVELLRARYPQYHAMPIDQQPAIVIRIDSVVAWGAIESKT
jgi:coenzyme F420-0:L-glutamate ligase / coenzyme F420-1:gamma-L-glutamate ligase